MKLLLSSILHAFAIPGEVIDYVTPADGNINRTFRVAVQNETGELQRYIFQALNTYVFPHPEEVMENIRRITGHLREKCTQDTILHFYETPEGSMLVPIEGELWRVCDEIPSRTCSGRPDLLTARQAGAAFGRFQMQLSDLDPQVLHEIIPGFHDTEARYRAFDESIQIDPLGRAAEVQSEIRRLMALRETACRLTGMQKCGELPLRVTHNDTKISNVLFAPDGRRAVAVIDLDTVMPGLVAHDYGDAIRSAANRSLSEDDPAGARLDIGILDAFSAGFLGETGAVLTITEKETLAMAPFTLATETAVRFLSDYILGDPYFRPRYPRHNLRRARMQLSLAEDLLARMPEIDAVIHRYLP